jgi:hypothetical protein
VSAAHAMVATFCTGLVILSFVFSNIGLGHPSVGVSGLSPALPGAGQSRGEGVVQLGTT